MSIVTIKSGVCWIMKPFTPEEATSANILVAYGALPSDAANLLVARHIFALFPLAKKKNSMFHPD